METNTTMTMETKIIAASILGMMAFNAGKPCIPALDIKNLEPLLAGNEIGEGIPVLKAWSQAWHDANICAQALPKSPNTLPQSGD